jgi:hypothetical protein
MAATNPRIMHGVTRHKPVGAEELRGLMGKGGVIRASSCTDAAHLAYRGIILRLVTCLGGGTGRRKGLKNQKTDISAVSPIHFFLVLSIGYKFSIASNIVQYTPKNGVNVHLCVHQKSVV